MKITLVSEYFYPDKSGGTPTDLTELFQSIRRNAPEVELEVITSKNLYRSKAYNITMPRSEVWEGIKIYRIGTPRSNRPKILPRLLCGALFSVLASLFVLCRRCDLLLVVTNPPSNGFVGWLNWKLRRVPFVYLLNDLYPDIAVALGRIAAGSKPEYFFRAMQGHWLRAAAINVVVGRCMQQRICTQYKLQPSRVVVIRNWADPSQIIPSCRDNDFRARFGLSGFVIMYGGNFSQYVDFDCFLNAANMLRTDANISFVLIGDGTRRLEVEEKVRDRGLSNVLVLPSVSRTEMNEVMAAADLCLISLNNRMLGLGSPGKLYTILAAGRAIAAFVPKGSEVARIIEENRCGVCLPESNPHDFVREIRRIIVRADIIEQMGCNARKALVEKYTLQHATVSFLDIFRAITEGKLDQQIYREVGV